METTLAANTPKVYVLALTGDPINSGGSVTIAIDAISLDRDRLVALMTEKNVELDEYFDDQCDCGEDDCKKNHADTWCYHNSDYSAKPSWSVDEWVLS